MFFLNYQIFLAALGSFRFASLAFDDIGRILAGGAEYAAYYHKIDKGSHSGQD
jgi:hypothetical protein